MSMKTIRTRLLGLLEGHVTTGPLKVAKFSQGFQFSPALRECESVRVHLRPLGNTAYVACLLRGPIDLMVRAPD